MATREARERAVKYRVGVFIVLSLIVLVGMVYVLGARARLFESRFLVHADFTEVGGLSDGATVRLAGVQIGRVTGVNLPGQPGGKVRVDMSITKKYGDRIRQDSVARIDTQGLLGDKIIEITVGTASAPPLAAGGVLAARDPMDIGRVLDEGAATVKNVAALAEGLKETTEALNRSKVIDDAAATMKTARRTTEQLSRLVDDVQKGKGWAHALLYEEPVALRKLNDVVASTQAVLDRLERGEGAIGVLTSQESTAAARRLVAAMERFAAAADGSTGEEGLLPALLYDPQYKAVLDDLRALTRNLREVSDRVAGGRGTLGSLVKDEPADEGLRQASRDLQTAIANLKEITEKLNEGEGTLGALIADPTLYDRLVSILEGAQRSFLLRGLLRSLGNRGVESRERGSSASPSRPPGARDGQPSPERAR